MTTVPGAAPVPGRAGTDWWIGLPGWVLQDGSYTDFAVGEIRQFAVEFGYSRHERLAVVDSSAPLGCEASGQDGDYRVTASVLRSDPEPTEGCCILDFGLLAYTEWIVLDDLQPPRVGTRLHGAISLSVDHFAYVDHLAHQPGVPPLIYTWTIQEIRLDTSPSIRVSYGHPLYVGPNEGPMTVRDPERRSWRSIDQTDMWGDHGSYTLRCTLHPREPVSTVSGSGTASPYGPLS